MDLALEQEQSLVQMPIVEVPHQDTEVGLVEASQVEVQDSEIQVPVPKNGDVNRNY